MEEGLWGACEGLGGVSGDKAEGIGANVRYWLLRVAPLEPDAGDPGRVGFMSVFPKTYIEQTRDPISINTRQAS